MQPVETGQEPTPTGALARGASFGLLAQAADKVLPVVLTLYLARALEPAEFGVFAFVFAYLALFQALTEYSLDTVLVRMMTQSPEQSPRIFRAGLALKLVLATLCAAASTLAAPLVSAGEVSMRLMFPASMILVTAMGATYRAFFRSRLEIRSVFYLASARSLLVAVAAVVAVAAQAGMPALFGAMAVANLVSFAGVAFVTRRRLPPLPSLDAEIWRRLFRGLGPLLANALAMTVSLRAGQVLLMSMRGPVEVGVLGAASRVVEAFTLLPEALMITVYPLMAGLHARDKRRLMSTAQKSTRYLAVATGVPVLACLVAGPAIMGLLYGPEWREAGGVLSILALLALLSAGGTVMLNLLVAVHRETMLLANTVVFAAVSLVLTVVGIRVAGYEGAAVAMVTTSFASQVTLALLPSTREYAAPCFRATLRTFAAVAIAAGVANTLGAGPWVEIPVALVVYIVALILLGVVNREEVRFVRMVVRAATDSRSGEAGDA